MKIVIQHDDSPAWSFVRQGLAKAFSALGHEVGIWNSNKKSPFDLFDEAGDFDIFIGQTYNLSSGLVKCIKERPNLKVILQASDWGNLSDKIDRNRYPVLIANQKEIDVVMSIKDRVNFIFAHYLQDRLDNLTHNHWAENDLNVKSLLSAADIFEYTNGKYKEEYASDIAFVGGRWGYKSVTFDRWFLPLLDRNKYPNLNIKIWGNQPWGVPQYMGYIPDSEVKHVLASAKVCINLSEPHSQDFGYDIIERPFKILSNHCFCISDYVEDMEKVFGDSIVYSRSLDKFIENILYWIEGSPAKRDMRASRGCDLVREKHTYLERAAYILENLGYEVDYNRIKEVKDKFK